MNRVDLKALTNEQLVERYAALSVEQYESTEIDDDETYNKLFHAIHAIGGVLRERDPEARRALLPLLVHENAQVRFNAAHELLAVEPARARAALEWVAKWGPAAQSGRAGMSLQALDSGQYKPT